MKASGEIKTVFTWQPNSAQTQASDPPPAWVLVQETSSAACLGFDTPSHPSSGSCDDGLGDSQSKSVMDRHFPISCTRTRYRAVPGRQTVSLTCSPSAQATGASGVMVLYNAAVFPITINLTGTTPDSSGNQNILVGQRCNASVSGIPVDLLNNTVHPPVYNWSVSGNTFQSWTVTGSGSTSSAKVKYTGDTTSATTHWYWNDFAGPQTVACTVTLTPPDGQGVPFSVTASQKVNLYTPQTTENPTLGRVQINNYAPAPPYPNNPAFYLGRIRQLPLGIIFTTQVQTPSLFTSQGSGSWNMVQGISPNTWKMQYGKTEEPYPDNGKSGLDTSYPFYPGGASSSFPQSVPANNLTAQPCDSPGIPSLSNFYVRYRTAQSFQTYIMYRPPGSDTQWVPIWRVEWNWNADASVMSAPGYMWSNWDDTNSPGAAAITSNSATTLFPTWSYALGG